jgi:protein O-GlcNAc transferase
MNEPESLYRAAIAEHRAGRILAADQLCRQLLARYPAFARGWDLLGMTLHQQGDCLAAIDCIERAIALEPLWPAFYHNLASACWSVGQLAKAESALARALQMTPDSINALATLGKVLYGQGRTAESIAVFNRVLALCPDSPAARAAAYSELAMTEEAIAAYQRAAETTGEAAFHILAAIQLPPVYDSREHLLACRRRLEAAIDALIAEGVVQDLDARPAMPVFSLPHQGFNDLEIQRKLARLYRPGGTAGSALCGTAGLSSSADARVNKLSVPPRSARLRVGFVSSYFNLHTVAKLTANLIVRLSRRDLDITVFSIGQNYDPVSRALAASVQRFVLLPPDVAAARRIIESNAVDVLVFTDIGMDQISYSLAFSRLAPVQCVTWGHPETTGLSTIDYFVSSDEMESPAADAHYSERLVRLPGLTFCLDRAVRPAEPAERAAFGLDPGKRLYACPQTIFKFHPDFDEALAGVLRRDPAAQLVVIRSLYPHPDELLRRRWARVMPDVADRIIWVRRLQQPEFMSLLNVVDVMLDPFPYGGGVTSLEAFSFGIPLVTLPTEFLRGRITQAFCHRLGIESYIARDVDDYVNIAVRLGTDTEFRKQIRERILTNQPRVFDDNSAVDAWEKFLRSVGH